MVELVAKPVQRLRGGPGDDEPLVEYDGAGTGTKKWLTADQQGSIVAVTDASGAATAINTYDEYGTPASTNQGRFQYTGQAWIAEIGAYDFKARDYSPTLGRFLQTDPIGYADNPNMYAYVGDDPVNLTDPSGLCPEATRVPCADKKSQPPTSGGDVVVSPTCESSAAHGIYPAACPGDFVGQRLQLELWMGHTNVVNVFTASGQSNSRRRKNPLACQASKSPLTTIADAADKVSAAADVTAVTAAGTALVAAPTVVGAIPAAGVAAGADAVSEVAGVVSVTANVFAGRWGNAAIGAVGVALGVGSGPVKAAPEITKFLNGVGVKGISHALDSICP